MQMSDKNKMNHDTLDMFLFTKQDEYPYMPEKIKDLTEIYHYTSPSGLLSIFGEKGKVTLWASRYDCLNDMSEGTIAHAVYQKVCLELKENQKISEEVFQLFSAIKPCNTSIIGSNDKGKISSIEMECNRYICSFSRNSDSLAMWNYYSKGDKYEGFSIGFCAFMMEENLTDKWRQMNAEVSIYPVVYDEQKQKEMIEKYLLVLNEYYKEENQKKIENSISARLREWGLIFKSEYFKHEQEVRIIVDIPLKDKSDDNSPVKYRMANGLIIPYIELKFEEKAVQSVCFGPLTCTPQQKMMQVQVMEEYLTAMGCHACVDYSKIPVRF